MEDDYFIVLIRGNPLWVTYKVTNNPGKNHAAAGTGEKIQVSCDLSKTFFGGLLPRACL